MRRKKKSSEENTSYWKSYSDMMAALLLMFILLMALVLFQYINKKEEKTEEEEYEESLSADLPGKEEDGFDLTEAIRDHDWTTVDDYIHTLKDAKEDWHLRYTDLEDEYAMITDRFRTLSSDQLVLIKDYDALAETVAVLQRKADAYDAQQKQLDTLTGVRSSIIQRLSDTFREREMKVEVDQQTGAIILAANLLFDFDEYHLRENSKSFLDDFLYTYFDVILEKEYLPYLSEIIIDGHTDHTGTYLYNLNLSQKRAYSIAEYCFADHNNHFSDAELDDIRRLVTANGRSWSHLIYDKDGKEDKMRSRRVEIKFRLVDETMIDEMKSILEQ